jgi:hypothetical protein
MNYRHRWIRVTIIVLLISAYWPLSTVGQCEAKNVFADVPLSVRHRLIERLNLLTVYEKNGEWNKYFDLLYPPEKNPEEYRKKKERYMSRNTDRSYQRKNTLIDFVPKRVEAAFEIGEGVYMITGCRIFFRVPGKIEKQPDIILAHLVESEWFFSSWGEPAPNKLCDP